MKKQMITVTSVAMALMLTLAGCTGSGNSQNADNTSNAGTNVDQPNIAAANEENDWFKAAGEYHAAHVEGHENETNLDSYTANFTVDGIPGELHYAVGKNSWMFQYNFDTYYPYVNYQFDFDENKGSMTFYDYYTDDQVFQIMTFLTGNGEPEINTAVDDLLNGKYDNCRILNDEALADHEEDIMADNKVLYARMCYMITELFEDMGLDYEDGNIYLADTYKNYDFDSKLSIEISNDHVFEDGTCKDCGMTWNEYMCEAVNKKGTEYYTYVGDNTLIGFDENEEMSYLVYDRVVPDLCIDYYRYTDENVTEEILLDFEDIAGLHENLDFIYTYNCNVVEDNGDRISYAFSIKSELPYNEFGQILTNKDLILENCQYTLDIAEIKGKTEFSSYDHELSDAEIKEIFGDKADLYLSLEQTADKYLALKGLEKIDAGLSEFDTSLADAGITIK